MSRAGDGGGYRDPLQIKRENIVYRKRIRKFAVVAIVSALLGNHIRGDNFSFIPVKQRPHVGLGLMVMGLLVAIKACYLLGKYLTNTIVMQKEDFDMDAAQFKRLLRVADHIHLDDKQLLELFYERFCWADADGTGTISIEEFLSFFEIDDMYFTRRLFRIVDTDNSSELDFIEFLLAVFNFCSFEWEGLVRFTFELFDEDGSESLDEHELEMLVQLVHGRQLDAVVTAALAEVRAQYRGVPLRAHEFVHVCRMFPVLLYPAVLVQTKMRGKVLGHRFWIEQAAKTARRLRASGHRSVLAGLVHAGFTNVARATKHAVRRASVAVTGKTDAIVARGRRAS
eukprot:g5393.t1